MDKTNEQTARIKCKSLRFARPESTTRRKRTPAPKARLSTQRKRFRYASYTITCSCNASYFVAHHIPTLVPAPQALSPQRNASLCVACNFVAQETNVSSLGGKAALKKQRTPASMAHWLYHERRFWRAVFCDEFFLAPEFGAIVSHADAGDRRAHEAPGGNYYQFCPE